MKTHTDFSDWLAAVPGRQQSLADSLGVSRQAAQQWGLNGVPLAQMQAVHTITRIPLAHLLQHALMRKGSK